MRPQQSGLVGQVRDDGALVPDVISRREQIDFQFQEFFSDLRRDAKAGCGVFHIGNAEIDPVLLDQAVQFFMQNPASGFPEDVADKEDSHLDLSSNKMPPRRRVARTYLNL